jgi:hypothetical protein
MSYDVNKRAPRVKMNQYGETNVYSHMAHQLKSIRALVLAFSLFPLPLASQTEPVPAPRALIEKALALSMSDKDLPRYTYFVLAHTQNRYPKGKLFLDSTTLYEYTWIGDLPYGRVIELQGKPLRGKAIAEEQAKYDKALADHAGLSAEGRAKAKHYYLLDTSLRLAPLLTPSYNIHELRQENLAGNPARVIEFTPVRAAEATQPPAMRHVTLWINDAGLILRETYEVVTDEPDKLHGSHGEEDFQLIDGNRLPLHTSFHLNAPNGNTGDFEDTYSRFRRFNASVRIVPATPTSGDSPDSASPRP